ncbi:N-acetylneuraminate synthase family protein [Shewanella algae]|uniref:N-acetylneuraminate synthase family protein n=1 Tax=Shewanella algae TaxID=38313 RepID=UPI0034D5A2F4
MIKDFQFGPFTINESSKTVVIAEAAVEHLGNLNVAMRMADAAKEVGVDIIKYQMHIPGSEMLPNKIKFWGGSLDQILDDFNLTVKEHELLIRHCENIGIQYLCTPFCAEAVNVLNDLGVVGFKTGSGELGNLLLMEEISKTGKPAIISTGMSTYEEIQRTVSFMKERNSDILLTNCTSIYPAPYKSINLRLIENMSKNLGLWVGHSDHTPNMWTAIGAVGMGAKVIEKHFTLNRFMKGPDASVSLEPSEFKTMIEGIRIIDEAKGTGVKEIHKDEIEVRDWAHHSIVTTNSLTAGHVLTESDLTVKRPGTGIPAAELKSLIGKELNRDIAENEMLSWTDFS